jgi:hypothetical protein
MIHVMNNLPTEYSLELTLLEERFGDTSTVEQMRAELSLRFDRSKMKSTKNKENEAVSLKVNAEIVDKSVMTCFSAKIVQVTIVEIMSE